MVLSLGIGTFTQLALRTTACPKAVPHAVASIPTAHMFYTTDFESFPAIEFFPVRNESDTVTLLLPALDVSMNTAIINGLSGLQSLGGVSPSCDTGNCSFTTYGNITHSTLGIESLCLDVSPFLTQTDNSTVFLPGNRSMPFVWTNYTLPKSTLSISYLVGGDPGYSMGARWYPLLSFDGGRMTDNLVPPSNYIEDYEISPDLSPQEEYLIKRSFYQQTFMIPTLSPCLERSAYPPSVDPFPLVNTSSCPQLGVTNVSTFPGYFSLAAVQCHLYPSVRHYAGSIVNGQIQETLVGRPVPLDYATDNAILKFDRHSEQEYDLLYYAFLDPCIIEGTVYTNANLSQVPGDRMTIRLGNGSEITGPNLCLYGASLSSIYALSDVLESSAFNRVDFDAEPFSSCLPSADHTGMKCRSLWWLEPLFNGGNASLDSVSAVMRRMTDAITNQLRMNGTDWYRNPSNVTGTAFQTVVCTRFQWFWLLFPAGMVFASAVLLVATAWRSSGRWRKRLSNHEGSEVLPVWKSSLLPLLFYGLEDGARLKDVPVEDKEMVGLAGEMMARLSFTEDGLRFHSAKNATRE